MNILAHISTLLLLASPSLCQWTKAFRLVTNALVPSRFRYGPPDVDTFDYIIVGAGPSGCVIANRLSEDENATVLLLEAGEEESLVTNVPILNALLALTDYAWEYPVKRSNRSCLDGLTYFTNNHACSRMTHQICPWTSGKGFGGGTVINNMIWTRGSALDYDRWAQLGFAGWSYDDILPYFKKIENMRVKNLAESPYHGTGGPVDIGYAPHKTPLLEEYINAGKAMGLEEINYNDPTTLLGISRIQGAFESSKLLMLSGIGHSRHLKTVGIKPLADLPVGDNLHSHPSMSGLVFLVNTSVTIKMDSILNDIGGTMTTFINGRRGILTATGSEAIAYFRTKHANFTTPGPSSADIELLFVSSGINTDHGEYLRVAMGISDEFYNSVYGPYNGRDSFSIWPILNYPQSRGTVRLRNKNPAAPPIIDEAFYKEEVDAHTMVEGIKIALALAKTEPLQKFGATLVTAPYPLCKSMEFGSDEYWRCAIRSVTTETHHQSGTCSMGKVVDERLRVYGVGGLRVADTSIAPILPGAHTQAMAYMIGEKAADLIKEDSKNANHENREEVITYEVDENVKDIHDDL